MSLPHLVLYVFETTRHRHLVRALGLPEWAVGTGYRYIQQGELPRGLARSDMKHTDE